MEQTATSLDDALEALRAACLVSVGEQHFVVFYRGHIHIVVGLNASAHLFAKIARSEISPEDITKAYATQLEIPEDIAGNFIEIIAEDWQRFGAIGPGIWLTHPPECTETDSPDTASADFDSTVCIGGDALRVTLHEQALAELTSPMIDGPGYRGAPADFSVHSWRHENSWHILTSSGQFEALSDIETTRDRILTILMQNSWPELTDAPCIHGATLRSPAGRHVMISGDSGRGKTTLALGLAKHKFTLLSDDMSVFDAKSGTIMPMKMNPSVKRGAWAALAEYYPELEAQAPIMVKGRLCKYIRRADARMRDAPHGIDALIFPKWQNGAAGHLSPYDDQEALLSMLRCSYLPNNQANLQAMADFLAGIPLYELTYSNFEQADRLLLDLLECPT